MADEVSVGVLEAARRLGISRRTAEHEIAAGRLRSFRVGRRRLVRVAALAAWAERRERLDAAPTARAPRRAATTPSEPVPFPEYAKETAS